MARVRLKVDTTGPLFQKDPTLTLGQNIQRMMEGLAEQGENLAKSAYPVFTGAGREGIVGRVESLGGKRWAKTAVVSQQNVYPWPGGGSRQYRGGKVGAPIFRRVTSSIRVVKADLTAGLE